MLGHGELQDGMCPQYCSSCVPHSVFEYFRSELKGAVEDLTKQLGELKTRVDVVCPWGGVEGEVGFITPDRRIFLNNIFKHMANPSTGEGGRNIRVRLGEKFDSEDVVHDTQCVNGGQSAVEERFSLKGKRGVDIQSPNVDRSAPGPRAIDLQGMTCSFDEALYHIEHDGLGRSGIPEAPSPIQQSQGMPKRPRRRESAPSLREHCLTPRKGPSQGPRGGTAHQKIGAGAPIQKADVPNYTQANSSKRHVACNNEVTMSVDGGVPTPSAAGVVIPKPDVPRRRNSSSVSMYTFELVVLEKVVYGCRLMTFELQVLEAMVTPSQGGPPQSARRVIGSRAPAVGVRGASARTVLPVRKGCLCVGWFNL